jgi:putative GTP pyrophosphokinase
LNSPLNRTWANKPEIIRAYYDRLQIYQRLCDEVEYILDKKIKLSGIEIGHLTSRAKTLASFCEKIERKNYSKPLEEISDLSGVRVVFLYASDRTKIEQLVEQEFDIHEKVDKVGDQGFEKFGYGALHYIVSLKSQHAGARYDDLKSLRCEIQIRTILQDAWAIVAHHLSYKNEEDVPKELKRRLHALSGLFETADDQFERINYASIEYQNGVKAAINSDRHLPLEAELNLDNLLAYMGWRFPDRDSSSRESASNLLAELHNFNYLKLKDIDHAVNKALNAVLASEVKYPPYVANGPGKFAGVGLIRSALEFVDDGYCKFRNGDDIGERKRLSEFVNLLK